MFFFITWNVSNYYYYPCPGLFVCKKRIRFKLREGIKGRELSIRYVFLILSARVCRLKLHNSYTLTNKNNNLYIIKSNESNKCVLHCSSVLWKISLNFLFFFLHANEKMCCHWQHINKIGAKKRTNQDSENLNWKFINFHSVTFFFFSYFVLVFPLPLLLSSSSSFSSY